MLWLIAAIIVLSTILVIGVRRLRARRLPVELRGDWWARFERDFRAYASAPPRPPVSPPSPRPRQDTSP